MENITIKIFSFFNEAKEVVIKLIDILKEGDFIQKLELKTIGFMVLFVGLLLWLITIIYKKKTHNKALKEEYELVAKQIVTSVKIEKQLEKEKKKFKKAKEDTVEHIVEKVEEPTVENSTIEEIDEELAEEDFKTSLLEGEDFKTTLLESGDDYKTTLLTNDDEDFKTSLL